MNNFIVEWNDHRADDLKAEGLVDDNHIIEAAGSAETPTSE